MTTPISGNAMSNCYRNLRAQILPVSLLRYPCLIQESNPKPKRRTGAATKKRRTSKASPGNNTIGRDKLVVTTFHNKAGEYELIRVQDNQVHYSFTNRQGKTVDSIMPLIMWQKIAARVPER